MHDTLHTRELVHFTHTHTHEKGTEPSRLYSRQISHAFCAGKMQIGVFSHNLKWITWGSYSTVHVFLLETGVVSTMEMQIYLDIHWFCKSLYGTEQEVYQH